jgi:hypothetical protein
LCFFEWKYTKGPTNPVDAIDRARRKASRNLLAASAQRRLEPACLSEKVVSRLFQHQLTIKKYRASQELPRGQFLL